MGSAKKTAMVIGITGGIGGEVARTLLRRSWKIRALSRRKTLDESHGFAPGDVQLVHGDAMNRTDVIAAAAGCAVIVHGANPPGYQNWRALALPMLRNTIAAASSSGARIAFPGTIYNFGPDAGHLLHEASPQRPMTRKGRIRVEMEDELRRAAQTGVQTTIVRAGDFFGPRAGNSWFSQGLVKPGAAVRKIMYPGPLQVGHAWAYLPDVAEVFAQLIERDTKQAFEVFHFRGHWLSRGAQMAEEICRIAGAPRSSIRALPWWAIQALSPFVTLFREMSEMRYLWQVPLELDNRKLLATLGTEAHTPLELAVRSTLQALGCLREDVFVGSARIPS